MPVFHVTFKCRPEQREVFLEKLKAEGIIAACRGEAGNISYDHYGNTAQRMKRIVRYCRKYPTTPTERSHLLYMAKRLPSLLLSLRFLIVLLPGGVLDADVVASGTCGAE
jgi:hypothetical protein